MKLTEDRKIKAKLLLKKYYIKNVTYIIEIEDFMIKDERRIKITFYQSGSFESKILDYPFAEWTKIQLEMKVMNFINTKKLRKVKDGLKLSDGLYSKDDIDTGDTSVLKKGDKFYIFEDGRGIISEPYNTIKKAFDVLFTEENHAKGC